MLKMFITRKSTIVSDGQFKWCTFRFQSPSPSQTQIRTRICFCIRIRIRIDIIFFWFVCYPVNSSAFVFIFMTASNAIQPLKWIFCAFEMFLWIKIRFVRRCLMSERANRMKEKKRKRCAIKYIAIKSVILIQTLFITGSGNYYY